MQHDTVVTTGEDRKGIAQLLDADAVKPMRRRLDFTGSCSWALCFSLIVQVGFLVECAAFSNMDSGKVFFSAFACYWLGFAALVLRNPWVHSDLRRLYIAAGFTVWFIAILALARAVQGKGLSE